MLTFILQTNTSMASYMSETTQYKFNIGITLLACIKSN